MCFSAFIYTLCVLLYVFSELLVAKGASARAVFPSKQHIFPVRAPAQASLCPAPHVGAVVDVILPMVQKEREYGNRHAT